MKVLEHQSLRLFNTFGIDVKARYFVVFEQVDDITEFLGETHFRDLPRLILGGGSNVLFRQDYPGVILQIEFKGIELLDESGADVIIRAAAGENWHDFVRSTIERGYAGLENLSLIPGTVGAAPIQNIGAYGVELREVFYELEAVDLETGTTKTFNQSAAQFTYRDSYFKSMVPGRWLITSVTFRMPKQLRWRVDYRGFSDKLAVDNEPLSAQRISDVVCQLRREKLPDPTKQGNAGSFFKNPIVSATKYKALKSESPELPGFEQSNGAYKLSAGWLIERCGWKGHREGDVGVSNMHALVLVNYGGASGESIWQLAQRIIVSVQSRFGVALEPEPRII
ncbi:MAG: UDP-N-acetylenolpyruvoylglucosamine reductase [Thiothrix sp.]|nr:MAG: UDP-N-acetylenolpyruvoylglucosamine reductase [Thiothrix sp.]